ILRQLKHEDSRIVAATADAGNLSPGARTLTVYDQQLDAPATAEEYLDSSGLLTELFPISTGEPTIEPTTLGGYPAISIRGVTEVSVLGGAIGAVEHVCVICGVLPGNHAVTVVLTKIEQPLDPDDVRLVEAVAATVKVGRSATTLP